ISHAGRAANHLGKESAYPRRGTGGGEAIDHESSTRRGEIDAETRVVRSHGVVQLLQLLYGDRRIFLAQAGRSSAGFTAGLGDRGDLAKSRNSVGGCAAWNR